MCSPNISKTFAKFNKERERKRKRKIKIKIKAQLYFFINISFQQLSYSFSLLFHFPATWFLSPLLNHMARHSVHL